MSNLNQSVMEKRTNPPKIKLAPESISFDMIKNFRLFRATKQELLIGTLVTEIKNKGYLLLKPVGPDSPFPRRRIVILVLPNGTIIIVELPNIIDPKAKDSLIMFTTDLKNIWKDRTQIVKPHSTSLLQRIEIVGKANERVRISAIKDNVGKYNL